MNKHPKIFIGLPTMGSIHTFLLVSLMTWFTQSVNSKDKDILVYPSYRIRGHDKARNHIVDEFLKTDATHLFFIDADTIPPLNALDKLLSHDKDIVSGITPIIQHDPLRANDSNGFYKKWNCVDMNDEHVKPNSGLVRVKGAGGSCILIKRSVFEKLDEPYYKFLEEDETGKKVEISEDIYFIMMAMSKGIEAYCDTSVIAGHEKEIIW